MKNLKKYLIKMKTDDVIVIDAEIMLLTNGNLIFEVLEDDGEARTVAIFCDWSYVYEENKVYMTSKRIVPVECVDCNEMLEEECYLVGLPDKPHEYLYFICKNCAEKRKEKYRAK